MAPDTIAYALREEYAGTHRQYADADDTEGTEVPIFTGGVVAVGDSDVDVRELLDEGHGVIIVDPAAQADLIIALDEYPAFKRVPVPDDGAITVGYADRAAGELRGELKRRGIAGAGNASQADAAKALEHFDALAAAGVTLADGTTLEELVATPPPGQAAPESLEDDDADGDDQEGAGN